ncbi:MULTISPECIES: AzlC family ABC transporter permease [unclassified Beijerinckia]|uniref:AzlC family ABC transporter permease n=1 Tax=unclassified Beijerinckia TaxID=2638183 RepID=UPI0008969ED2|nr:MULTISPECIES: AzlC family ABC transporter permease [unclassified Beijerinckia]MDH7794525.1 putative branched-subunit amino acid permease [Beijerinckia sp. GAS462]SEB65346.1 Predicted branched-chain amino acid permease (azaleucine resistance) [Beijerinckia sp. 28-YEA-48]
MSVQEIDPLGKEGWPYWLRRGMMVAARLPIFVMAFTFLGIGGLAREAGVPLGVALLSTLTIWAGPAQVIYFGALINGVALPAIALSISLSSIRLLPMCVSLLPTLRKSARSRPILLYAMHQVAVTVWAESIQAIRHIPPAGRLPWFMGLAHSLVFAALIATWIGYTLAAALPHALAAGLLFITPIYFTSTLARNAREPIDWIALSSGFVLAPLLKGIVGAGLDLMIIGLVGGTAAWLWQKRIRRHGAHL